MENPIRQTIRMLLAGCAVACLAWVAVSNTMEKQRVDAASLAAGFEDAKEYQAATAKGFDKPDSYRRFLDTERVEQQKRDAAAAQAKAAADAQKAKDEALWQEAARYARALKQSMKNPDSFKLEAASRTREGFYCFEYRATNSFNAVIPGKAIVGNGKAATTDNKGVFVPLWNKHCTKAGESLPNLIYALKSGLI